MTLTESVTISPVNFIFAFQPISGLDEYKSIRYFTVPNTSIYKNRYDLFLLTEADAGTTGNSNNVPIYLKPNQYTYNIYESTTTSFNPNSFGKLLETGKMVVGDMTIEGQDTNVLDIYK